MPSVSPSSSTPRTTIAPTSVAPTIDFLDRVACALQQSNVTIYTHVPRSHGIFSKRWKLFRVGGLFARIGTPGDTCRPNCHPRKCDGQAPKQCNCEHCTSQAWNRQAKGATCGARILFFQSAHGSTEEEASRTAAMEYPRICGSCHPLQCNATMAPTTSPVPTRAPTTLMPVVSPDAPYCGCFACTAGILATDEDGFTCLERVEFLRTIEGGSRDEYQACRIVAEQFPDNQYPPSSSILPNGQTNEFSWTQQRSTDAPTTPIQPSRDSNLIVQFDFLKSQLVISHKTITNYIWFSMP